MRYGFFVKSLLNEDRPAAGRPRGDFCNYSAFFFARFFGSGVIGSRTAITPPDEFPVFNVENVVYLGSLVGDAVGRVFHKIGELRRFFTMTVLSHTIRRGLALTYTIYSPNIFL